MWDLLTDGKSRPPRTAAERQALERYNDVLLCKKFGWTPKDIEELDHGWYMDCIAILNLKEFKQSKKK